MAPAGIVETPTPYAPLAEWLRYRDDLAALDDSPGMRELIRQADEMIQELRGNGQS